MSIPFIADETTPGPGIYKPVSNLTRVVAGNAGPFTYTGTGTYILHNDKNCVVIDPGPTEPTHIENILEAIGQRTLDAILITHTHRDHSPASKALKAKTDAPIFGCAPAPKYEMTQSVHLEESQDRDYRPDRVLNDGDHLSFACGKIKVVSTPGHLSNHLCFLWEQKKALFSGDHVMGWATSVVIPPDGNMTAYMASLDKILGLDLETIWPTHGQPITEPQIFVKALIAHRKERERTILEQIKAGTGHIMDIVEALYQATPRALFPAAALSVYAHVIDLHQRGVIKTDEAVELTAFFTAT